LHPDNEDALGALLVFPKNVALSLNSEAEIKKFFQTNFPELVPALNEIIPALLENPDGNFATIHTDPWYYKDFMAIVGDAAHGFYPFFGQGTSAAFGDCVSLVNLIDTYGTDWKKIFPLYQEQRKGHTDALGELSKEALFKNLRDRKADYDAIYDRLELTAYRLFPKLLYPPLSLTIPSDPEHAARHRQQYLKQRKIANNLGASFLVSFLTGAINLYEQIKPATHNHE
jgi:2-polyprenyl-6-methoxyphenol hydroxylase-like FAD-dependent oxidoreductase